MCYQSPKIVEIKMSSSVHCNICNSEAFSCYLSLDERNDYLRKRPTKKLIFLHGFASSYKSKKAELLDELLPDYEVIAPDIPIDPVEALPFLLDFCQQEQPDVIVGKCMGAMYGQQMVGYRRICINPEFCMSQFLREGTGTYEYLNQRRNGEQTFSITNEIISHFELMENHQFDGLTERDRDNVWILQVGKSLTEGQQNLLFSHFRNISIYPDLDRVDRFFFTSVVVPLIRQINCNGSNP